MYRINAIPLALCFRSVATIRSDFAALLLGLLALFTLILRLIARVALPSNLHRRAM
jgi:hypothetical protein